MVQECPGLWQLTSGTPHVDARDLAAAIEAEVASPPLDFRTRLLVRDSLNALCAYWGEQQFQQWLAQSAQRSELIEIRSSDLGAEKFPSLRHRIMDAIRPETVQQFFRELGTHVSSPLTVNVGGAIALILDRMIVRATEDIDLVDEIPAELRSRHDLLDNLAHRFGLRLTHFQSHYLPAGWQSRVHSLGRFGQLDVFVVDPIDIFAGKLFSAREKDLDDLRMLARQLDQGTARRRVMDASPALLADPQRAAQAQRNWYIVYGEGLFPNAV